MNSVGILSAGGLGRVLAHWIINGAPGRRRHRLQRRPVPPVAGRRRRTAPRAPPRSSARCTPRTRPASSCGPHATRCSPPCTTDWSSRAATCARCRAGRAPTGSPAPGVTPAAEPTWGQAPWFEQWEAEHRAVREGVGLMDMAFMAKFRVQGADAGDVLDRVSAGAVNGEAETITYTQWLDDDGRIEADLTVTKLGEDDFFVVASDTAHGHTLAWLARHTGDADCTVTDVTADYGQLNVQGPRSRDVLAELTDADLSTEAFGFRTAGWVELAGVRRAAAPGSPTSASSATSSTSRRPTPWGCTTRCWPPGRRTGCDRSGSRRWPRCGWRRPTATSATTSTTPTARSRPGSASRSPSTSLAASSVATPCWPARRPTPPPAGWSADRAGPGARPRAAAVPRRDPATATACRSATSGPASYGWTLGGAVGLAMVSGGGAPVTPDWLAAGTWEVDVAGVRHPAEVSLRPMYDPTSARIKV